jgi:hypothetical protein
MPGIFITTTGAPTGDYRTRHRYVTVEDLAQIIRTADAEQDAVMAGPDVLAEALIAALTFHPEEIGS